MAGYDMPAKDAARFGIPGWRIHFASMDHGAKLGVAIEGMEGRPRFAVRYTRLSNALQTLRQWANDRS